MASASMGGVYGFVDAFNPTIGWFDTDVIGINVGILLLSAENMRTESVWRWFMQNREMPAAMNRIGLLKSSKRNRVRTTLFTGSAASRPQ